MDGSRASGATTRTTWPGSQAIPTATVINILRSHSADGARVHRASCQTINGQNPRGGTWTGRYVKVCADHLAELEQWAIDQVGRPIPPCGTCHPARCRRTSDFNQAERDEGDPGRGARGAFRDPRTDAGQRGSSGLGR